MRRRCYTRRTTMIAYPSIDPILVSIGPFGPVGPLAIRWYGLMYVIGFAVAWWLGAPSRGAARFDAGQPTDVDDVIFFAAIGVILGGRLGWILFYGTEQVLADPLTIVRIWEGGMSFHGGLIGAHHRGCNFRRADAGAASPTSSISWRRCPGSASSPAASATSSTASCGASRPTRPGASPSIPRVLHPMQAAEAQRLCERFVDRSVRAARARFAALRGPARRPAAVRDPVGVHRTTAAAACTVRAVSDLLRRVPFRRRIRARAGRESRLSAVRLGDDGPDPLHADDHRRPGAPRDRLSSQSAERQSATADRR